MSLLELVNMIFFQWFFIRITTCKEKEIEEYRLLSFDMMSDGNIASRGTGKYVAYKWYEIMYFVLPFTGWGIDYVYLTKKAKFIKITNKKIIK